MNSSAFGRHVVPEPCVFLLLCFFSQEARFLPRLVILEYGESLPFMEDLLVRYSTLPSLGVAIHDIRDCCAGTCVLFVCVLGRGPYTAVLVEPLTIFLLLNSGIRCAIYGNLASKCPNDDAWATTPHARKKARWDEDPSALLVTAAAWSRKSIRLEGKTAPLPYSILLLYKKGLRLDVWGMS